MRMMKTLGRLTLLASVSAVTGWAQTEAPAFTLKDANGVEHSLSQYADKIVVLEWTNYECPFVRKFYVPGAMQKLQADYTAKGVVWLSICSSAPGKQGHFSNEEWNKHIAKLGVKATAVLLDPDGTVGKAYGAKTTPHMFVVGKDGKLAYQGAIDDKRSTNSEDIAGARNYVVEALDALLADKPVAEASTPPYGCSVKY